MPKLQWLILAGSLVPAAASAGIADARHEVRPMVMGAPVVAPIGFIEMCQRSPQECESLAAGRLSRVVVADPARASATALWAAAFSASRPDYVTSTSMQQSSTSASSLVRQPAPVGVRPSPTWRLAPRLEWAVTTSAYPAVLSRAADVSYRVDSRWSPLSATMRTKAFDDRLGAAATELDATDRSHKLNVARIPFTTVPPSNPFGQRQAPRFELLTDTPLAVPDDVKPTPANGSNIRTAVLSLRQITAINRGVNRSIRRSSDEALYGRADFWTRPTGRNASGDCEDYVLAKRQALIDAGMSAEALSIAVVKTTRGETHAVLLVATGSGEYVLDNLSPWVLPWPETPYDWIERQKPGTPLEWVALQGGSLAHDGSPLLAGALTR
ncbi:hypothetical protein BH10PSE1_BH10PSE1_26100 [soil metagenome]